VDRNKTRPQAVLELSIEHLELLESQEASEASSKTENWLWKDWLPLGSFGYGITERAMKP